jgi:hypothetical protein
MKYLFCILMLFSLLNSACSEKKQMRVDCAEVCAKNDTSEEDRIFREFSTEKQYDFAVSCTGEKICCGDSNCTGFSAWLVRNKGVDQTVLEKLKAESDKDAQLDFLRTFVILNVNHELELKGRQDIAEAAGKIADEMTNPASDIFFAVLGAETRSQETRKLAEQIKEKTK